MSKLKPSRTCNRDGCDKVVPVGRRAWCSTDCREIARAGARIVEGRSDILLERKLLKTESEVQAARRAERDAKEYAEELQQALEDRERELQQYARLATVPTPDWMKRPLKDRKDHHGTLLALLSDTHYGEHVDPGEMDGYNAYDLEIAALRTKRFFERTVIVARHYLAGVKYDGIVLALGGDLASGDIHDELTETNEATIYETVEWTVPRLAAGINVYRSEFGKVHVVSAPGNHGRRRRKPQFKRRSADNADSHIARLLAAQFASVPDVTFDVPPSLDARFNIYDWKFSLEHGDQAKGGDGQVGALGPAKRMALRKQTQMAAEGNPFDVLILGHFHQLFFGQTQGFVMNGSLKGYDEYARGWHFKPERAQQGLLVVTPEHGITMSAPIIAQHRKSEGW